MLRNNNKGMSLIELMISSVLLALIIGGFMSMMASSMNMFSKGSGEMNMQEEAQIVANQIEDIVCDANVYVKSGTSNEIVVFNTDKIYRIYLDSASGKLQYAEYNWPDATHTKEAARALDVSTLTATVGPVLMADYVTGLTMDTSNLDTKNYISLLITYSRDNKQFSSTHSIYLRNMVGTGTATSNVVGTEEEFDEEITLVRYEPYQLDADIVADSLPASIGSKYTFDKANKTVSINTASVGVNEKDNGTVFTCTKGTNTNYRIKMTFDEVGFGIPGEDMQIITLDSQTSFERFNFISARGVSLRASGISCEVTTEVMKLSDGTEVFSGVLPSNPSVGMTDASYYKMFIVNKGYSINKTVSNLGNYITTNSDANKIDTFQIQTAQWNGSAWTGTGSTSTFQAALYIKADAKSNNFIISQPSQYTGNQFNMQKYAVVLTLKFMYNGSEIGTCKIRLKSEDAAIYKGFDDSGFIYCFNFDSLPNADQIIKCNVTYQGSFEGFTTTNCSAVAVSGGVIQATNFSGTSNSIMFTGCSDDFGITGFTVENFEPIVLTCSTASNYYATLKKGTDGWSVATNIPGSGTGTTMVLKFDRAVTVANPSPSWATTVTGSGTDTLVIAVGAWDANPTLNITAVDGSQPGMVSFEKQ